MTTLEEERGAAVRAVQLAALLTSKVQKSLASSETQSKDDASPVTVADCTLRNLATFLSLLHLSSIYQLRVLRSPWSKDVRLLRVCLQMALKFS